MSVGHDQVAALFTEPVADPVSDTNTATECAFHLRSDGKVGLQLDTDPDVEFWKQQFTDVTPLPGIGDTAVWMNNGLIVITQQGPHACMAAVTVDKLGQLNAVIDRYAIKASARAGYAAKLGAVCTTLLS